MAKAPQAPEPYQWVAISDFSPGIISQTNYAAANNANPVPGNKNGMAQRAGTRGCIALPNGGIGPLPAVSKTVLAGVTNPVQTFINGALIYGPVSIDNSDEILYGSEYIDGSGNRKFVLNSYIAAADTISQVISIGPSPNIPDVGIESFTGGPTRVNTSDPTQPGQPCIAFSYTFNSTLGVQIFNSFYPDPSAPGAIGHLDMTPSYTGFCVPHQNRVLILSNIDYQWVGTINGVGTIVFTNENFNYTDPPNSDDMGAQNEVFIAEQPFGMGAWGSISAGELFLVKQAGGGFIIYGDLNAPTVIYLAGVQPTKGIYNMAAQTIIGLVYASKDSGVWLWNGSNTSQKLSNNLNDDFWDVGAPAIQFCASSWDNWIAMTNGWLYDMVGGGWWQLADPGFVPLYYGAAFAGTGMWCVAESYENETDPIIAFYSNAKPGTSYTWQSFPMPETINQILDVLEGSVRAQGIGTVEVTVTARDGTTSSTTLTYDSLTQPDLQRGKLGLTNASDVTITLISTGTGGNPAPIIYSASIGFIPTSPANAT